MLQEEPSATCRDDSLLSPALEWDGQNSARERGEWLIGLIEQAAALLPPYIFDRPQDFMRGDGQVSPPPPACRTRWSSSSGRVSPSYPHAGRGAWGVCQVAISSDLSTVQVTPRHGPSPPGFPRSLSPLLLHWLGFSCNKVDANEGTPPVNRAHLTHGDLPDGELRCLRLEVV